MIVIFVYVYISGFLLVVFKCLRFRRLIGDRVRYFFIMCEVLFGVMGGRDLKI